MEYIDQALGELYTELTGSGLWHDEKVLADAVMLAPPAEILAEYRRQKAEGPVDPGRFFAAHFRPVGGGDLRYHTRPDQGPREHLEELWPHLTRAPDDPAEISTRFPLPFPYVVAGGRFQEAYYWDSFFIQLGLLKSGRLELAHQMLRNFAHALAIVGHIPNGFRSYFLTRSQPPYLSQMVTRYGEANGDPEGALAEFLPAMEAEHAYFTQSAHNHDGLARFWDEAAGPRVEMMGADAKFAAVEAKRPGFYRDLRAACESGWDFSARWLADPLNLATIRTTRIWAVDLNCLLYLLEDTLAKAAPPERAGIYRAAAEARAEAIRSRFFDAERGYFFDVLIDDGEQIPITTAAGLTPLWAGIATGEQARAAAEWAERHLMQPGGLLATDIASGQQWDAPNGWAPLNWIAIQGFRRYGMEDLAEELRRRWLATCDAVFRETGKFVEKYNVIDPLAPSAGGEYALQDGFGWTNGVYLDLL